jgi:hypothetical protein
MATKKYFEEFELNDVRPTKGRTVTETDIVIHVKQWSSAVDDSFHFDPNCTKPC